VATHSHHHLATRLQCHLTAVASDRHAVSSCHMPPHTLTALTREPLWSCAVAAHFHHHLTAVACDWLAVGSCHVPPYTPLLLCVSRWSHVLWPRAPIIISPPSCVFDMPRARATCLLTPSPLLRVNHCAVCRGRALQSSTHRRCV
jgi:hypothetical protein